MLSKEVLDLLKITRQTLTRYVKTGIIVMSEIGSAKLDSEEIISLLHCYSMKLYSKKSKKDTGGVGGR